jgi:isovaleryl-CoA dehydrogenase
MISIFADAAGLEVRGIETTGGREVNDVFFTNCTMPAARLLQYDMQSHVRVALGATIYGGTNEIQRDIIAKTFRL